jgi:hypothetical protein
VGGDRDGVAARTAGAGPGRSGLRDRRRAGERGARRGRPEPFHDRHAPWDFVAEGTGLDGKTAATIEFDTIPEDARLVGAVLYGGFVDQSRTPAQGALRVNNTIVNGEFLGSVRACWRSGRSSFAYRGVVSRDRLLNADARPLGSPLPPHPAGNGTYLISGFPIDDPTEAQGVTMILVYEHDAMRVRDVVFTDGNLMPTVSPPPPFVRTTRVPIGGFAATAPVEATSTFVVGNGSTFARDQAFFESRIGLRRFVPGHAFDSSDGPWWDTESHDLIGLLEPGDRTGTAAVRIIATPSGGLFALDCLIWAAHVLSVTSSNPPDPDPGAAFRQEERLAGQERDAETISATRLPSSPSQRSSARRAPSATMNRDASPSPP